MRGGGEQVESGGKRGARMRTHRKSESKQREVSKARSCHFWVSENMDPPETSRHGRLRHKCALSAARQLYPGVNPPLPQTYINPYINLPSQLYPKHHSNRIPHTPPKTKDAWTQTPEVARYTRRKGTQTESLLFTDVILDHVNKLKNCVDAYEKLSTVNKEKTSHINVLELSVVGLNIALGLILLFRH